MLEEATTLAVPGDGMEEAIPAANESQQSMRKYQAQKLGAFPFPLNKDGSESRQLVWVRTHSNYLASRGAADYLRALAVLARGIIGNFIIGLPILLMVAALVAFIHISGWGFELTITLGILIVAWIVLAPLVTRLGTIVHVKKIVEMGSSGSVASRGRYEAGFGLLLILAMLALLVEGLSSFLDDFHLVRQRSFGWPQFASGATVALGVLASMGKALPGATGLIRRLVLVVVGVLGSLLPLVVVMFVADYLVFSAPGWRETDTVLSAALLLVVALGIGLAAGLITGAFTGMFILKSLGTLTLTLTLLGFGVTGLTQSEEAQDELEHDMAAFDWQTAPTTEFNGLIAALLDRPPNAVTELVSFLEDSRQSALFFEPICTATPDSVFREANCDLDFEALNLPGLLSLTNEIDTVAEQDGLDSFTGQLVAMELRELKFTAEVLSPLFYLHLEVDSNGELVFLEASESGEPLEVLLSEFDGPDPFEVELSNTLLEYILDELSLEVLQKMEPSFHDAVERGIVDPEAAYSDSDDTYDSEAIEDLISFYASEKFPTLHSLAPTQLSIAMLELGDLNDLLYGVRLESARSLTLPRVNAQVEFTEVLTDFRNRIRNSLLSSSLIFGLVLAGTIWAYGWLALDPNNTSLHAMYRDRLARAFLIGADTKGDIDIEDDLDLDELSNHDAGSTAPYHLINAAINLQGSKDVTIGDRKSDFFIFSKRFVGSERSGYCRSETMEQVFPQMSVATAMAISGAAAAPNMGRTTNPMLTSFMALLNVRLGIWIPNPGQLEDKMGSDPGPAKSNLSGFSTDEVLKEELGEVARRWKECGLNRTAKAGLVGLAFSGGGVRSATLNLGIVQALHAAGVFEQVDYMSTVSGGGYLGSSISVAMRSKEVTRARSRGRVEIVPRSTCKHVVVQHERRVGQRGSQPPAPDIYEYAVDAQLAVTKGRVVARNDRLIQLGDPRVIAKRAREGPDAQAKYATQRRRRAYGDQYRWRVRPSALFREMMGKPHARGSWVNVSDGGHIENLATVELLRRRCMYIIVGDAEMDPQHEFNGLAILMRTARVELGIDIEIDVEPLRVNKKGRCKQHWVIGCIHYPEVRSADGTLKSKAFKGYMLYLKSSLVGDEGEDIRGYQAKNPAFPHQSTADQFFDEGQFESHRALGEHIASAALRSDATMEDHLESEETLASFSEVEAWFHALWQTTEPDDTTSF